ncbi:MAG: glycosyltransferase family 39 protein, partial [Pseudomonadota bacterium]
MWTSRRTIALALFGILFTIGVLTRSPSMVTWDEPENYYVGRVYLNTLTGGDMPQALPFRSETHWERYPPFAITIASMSSRVLSETLHITNPIDAHHIAVIGFAALGAVATYGIAVELGLTVSVAVIAAVVVFFSPIYFGHAHTNPKDIPQAAMFTLAVYAGLVAFRKKTYTAYICAGLVWGCALATKLNALFVPIILCLWFFLKNHTHTPGVWVKCARQAVLYGCSGLITLLILWPWLASDPVKHVGQIVQYIGEVGRGLPVLFFGHLYHGGIDVPWWYAPTMVLMQTPPVVLVLVAIGMLGSKKRVLPLVWFIVVFARYLDPHTIIYNGVRHVMEVFGAVALLAGMGLEYMWQ